MLDTGMESEDLPVRVWRRDELPEEVREAVHVDGLLNLGGVHGDRNTGNPVEYDHLKLVLTDDTVEITIFNRGIALFTTDDERVQRIHRVLCPGWTRNRP